MLICAVFFLFSLGLCFCLIGFLRLLAFRFNFITAQGIACVGGIGIWLSFFAVYGIYTAVYGEFNRVAWSILLCSLPILIFGVIDDYKKELSVGVKFLVQAVAVVFLVLSGITTRIIYLSPALNFIVTFLWVIGITNAFNHLDILDGLSGSVGLICSLAFCLIALFHADFAEGIFSLVLAGGLAAFLRYNLSGAKVYLGNSGSHFLGFTLSAIAISMSYATMEKRMALFAPIVVLGLPVFDTIFLIFKRAYRRLSIFRKSEDHLALRLLAAGYSARKTLVFMCLFCVFFCFCGFVVSEFIFPANITVLFFTIFVCLWIGRKVRSY